jgi:hypothetical protein
MTAILILIGVGVVIIAVIVLVTVPVTHVEAVARGLTWRRSVRIGTRVWVKRRSRRKPRTLNEVQSVKIQNPDDPKKLRYTYEERIWRYTRSVSASGSSQETVHDPEYTLAGNEEARGKRESYEADFISEQGYRYSAKIRFTQWKSLKAGAPYRLGRNTFGRVRTVGPARPAPKTRSPEPAQRDIP